jgi:hypothetical protein
MILKEYWFLFLQADDFISGAFFDGASSIYFGGDWDCDGTAAGHVRVVTRPVIKKDAATCWRCWESSGSVNDEWVSFRFCSAEPLSEIGLVQCTGRAGYDAAPIKTVHIEYSKDGTQWNRVQTATLHASMADPHRIEIPAEAPATRFVRLFLEDAHAGGKKGYWLCITKVSFKRRSAQVCSNHLCRQRPADAVPLSTVEYLS